MGATGYQATRTATSGLGDTSAELLKMSQPFSLQEVATEKLVVTGTATVYRDRRIDTSAMVAANRELTLMKREMAEEVARQILDRIQRAYRQPQTRQASSNDSASAAQ
jgi:LPS-assembly lipoprotein